MSARASLVNRASMSAQLRIATVCVQHGHSESHTGGREGGGEERRGVEMSVVSGSCGPWSLKKNIYLYRFYAAV